MEDTISVLIHGILGRMGQAVAEAVSNCLGLQLVGGVDVKAEQDRFQLAGGVGEIPLSSHLEPLLKHVKPDVMVDFTQHDAVMPAVHLAAKYRVNLVIGTTGLSEADLEEIDRLSKENDIGAVVAANFSLGAVLLMHLSKLAGKYFDYAEIIEMHHEQKLDSPSGTALATAKGMIESRGGSFTYPITRKESLKGARGAEYEGIAIHSVRSPGYMAHQEVILGGPGQTLKIRHDQISRDAFGPGITMAIKKVVETKGLIFGLDRLLGLQEA